MPPVEYQNPSERSMALRDALFRIPYIRNTRKWLKIPERLHPLLFSFYSSYHHFRIFFRNNKPYPFYTISDIRRSTGCLYRKDPLPPRFIQKINARSDVICIRSFPDRHSGRSNTSIFPCFFIEHLPRYIFTMNMFQPRANGFYKGKRIITGDQRIPGVKIDPQPFRVKFFQDAYQQFDVVRKRAMRFKIDSDPETFCPLQYQSDIMLPLPDRFFIAPSFRFASPVRTHHIWTSDEISSSDRPPHILYAIDAPFAPCQRKSSVDLRHLQAILIQHSFQLFLISIHRKRRLIA